ncbi:alpha/beta hydrolase [Pseudonocardia kongjuensis]|uniref:Alpha/beta hydrolase n=1 Tax=Pseudonocardia kongjuensis TaxID=102227 RepID=A0ABN1XMM3_9PSEU
MRTFVLVHGAWHGAGHLCGLARELTCRGHRAIAVDLPGHGTRARFPSGYPDRPGWPDAPSPLAGLTLDDLAGDLLGLLRGLDRPGEERPVVVAHSIGGVVATRAAELAPGLVGELVYLAAFVPTVLGAAGAYLATPEAAAASGASLYLGDPAATGAVRIDPRRTDPGYRRELRETYLTGLDDADALAHALTPDQPLCLLGTDPAATAGRWGSVPRRYLRAARDRALPPGLQDLMISHADATAPATAFRTDTLDAGHALFASHPAAIADLLGG